MRPRLDTRGANVKNVFAIEGPMVADTGDDLPIEDLRRRMEGAMGLSHEQVGQYFDEGFLVVVDVFAREELQPALDDFERIVDEAAERLYEAGEIEDKHAGEGVYTRLISLENECRGGAPLLGQRESPRAALAKLWASDKLLDMVEQFIGPDISGHPVCVLRAKTPDAALVSVDWHQDSAYAVEEAAQTLQPTAWIPFLDATVENGTLEVIRGSHKPRRIFPHDLGAHVGHSESSYLYIKEENLPPGDVVACEAKMGSVVWHSNVLVHRSTENRSDKVRWSCDIRYQRPGETSGYPEDAALGKASLLVPMRKSGDPEYRPSAAQAPLFAISSAADSVSRRSRLARSKAMK